jgi:carbon storage regulator
MLVLTRRKEQRIVMSNGVEIVIVDVKNGNVRIGITAPKDVAIIRPDATDKQPKHEGEKKD